jgi:hypothetical protein
MLVDGIERAGWMSRYGRDELGLRGEGGNVSPVPAAFAIRFVPVAHYCWAT